MSADWSVVALGGRKATTRPDRAIARLAAAHWGVLSVDELRRCGLSYKAIEVRVRNGHLHLLYRGVYAAGHAKLTREGACLAAVKACGPTAVLSHYSAAALYRLVPWDDRYPEVTTTTTKRRHEGIRITWAQALTQRQQTTQRIRAAGAPT